MPHVIDPENVEDPASNVPEQLMLVDYKAPHVNGDEPQLMDPDDVIAPEDMGPHDMEDVPELMDPEVTEPQLIELVPVDMAPDVKLREHVTAVFPILNI